MHKVLNLPFNIVDFREIPLKFRNIDHVTSAASAPEYFRPPGDINLLPVTDHEIREIKT